MDVKTGAGGVVRPPLPPKGDGQTVAAVPPPQPPPRKNKRAGFLSNSTFSKKDQVRRRVMTDARIIVLYKLMARPLICSSAVFTLVSFFFYCSFQSSSCIFL